MFWVDHLTRCLPWCLTKNIVDKTVSIGSLPRPEETTSSSPLLIDVVYSVCFLQNTGFHNLVDEHKRNSGNLFAKLWSCCMWTLLNTSVVRCQRRLRSQLFNAEDVEVIVSLCNDSLKPGSCGRILCSAWKLYHFSHRCIERVGSQRTVIILGTKLNSNWTLWLAVI